MTTDEPPEIPQTTEVAEITVRRVLVALDASPSSREAARAAVELALRSQARIEGLFVEDRTLLELAELALTEPARLLETLEEEWSPKAVERWLGLQAVRARRNLEEAAAPHGLEFDFQVVRGNVTEEILRRVPEVDVLVIGRVGWSGGRTGRLGRTAATILARSRGVLIPHGSSGKAVLRLLLR
jgi:nucleotide-binding universal stress UspA family protein